MKTVEINGVQFEVVKPYTKKAENLDWSRKRAGYTSVYEAYKTPSPAKVEIDKWWQRFCNEIDGTDYRIPSRNTNQFSVSFIAMVDGETRIFYITKAHNYII